MTRGEVGLAVGLGVLLMLLGTFTALGAPVFGPVLERWYVGAGIAVVARLLVVRGLAPRLARVLGWVGVIWIAAAVSWYVVLVVLLVALGPLR